MIKSLVRVCEGCLLGGALSISSSLLAAVPGVAPGIPAPEHRNVIVQLFNWKFNDIKAIIPELKTMGYSHIHVSPPQKSNEYIWNGGDVINPSTTPRSKGHLAARLNLSR